MSLFGVIRDKITNAAAKVSANFGLKVNPNINTSVPIDLYFVKSLGAPTTLSVVTAEEDKTITIVSTVGFAIGSCLLIVNSASDRFYFADILNIAGSVVTVDSPLDFAFSIGDTVVPLTKDMNVDASGSNQIFAVQAGGVASTLRIAIHRVIFTIQGATAMDDGKFGSRAALANGIVLRRNNGVMNNIYNIKTNGEFGQVAGSDKNYDPKAPAGTDHGITVQSTFAGENKHGTVIWLETGDSLELVLQDDHSSHTRFTAMAQGNIIDETAQ